MATNYSRGADFERRVAKDMQRFGYCATRAAGSHTPADVWCLMAGHRPVLIQCKRDGRLDTDDWNTFMDYCQQAGATPVLAMAGSNGRGIAYRRLVGRKDGSRREQPLAYWVPQVYEGNQDGTV